MLTLQLCVCVVPLLLPLNLSFDTVESHQVSATALVDSLHRLTSLKGEDADDDADDDDDRPGSKDRKQGHKPGDKEVAHKRGERDNDRRTSRGHGQVQEKFHGPQNGHGFSAGPMSGLVFELLDLNGDGNLSRDEFQRLVAAVEKSHPRPPQHDGPHAHGPQAHGPQAHGPHAHGPQAHGPEMHSMPRQKSDGRAAGARESHGFGPRPPLMHGFRPEFRPDHAGPRPEFRRPEMSRPEAHESKEPHRDRSSRSLRPVREETDRDKLHEGDSRDDDRHRKGDEHDKGKKIEEEKRREEKPLSHTRPNELPHHMLPFDWI